MPRTRRSQRTELAGSVAPSSVVAVPRAGGALGTMISCAPSSAASVPASECHASSHTSIAARAAMPWRNSSGNVASSASPMPSALKPSCVKATVTQRLSMAVDLRASAPERTVGRMPVSH